MIFQSSATPECRDKPGQLKTVQYVVFFSLSLFEKQNRVGVWINMIENTGCWHDVRRPTTPKGLVEQM